MTNKFQVFQRLKLTQLLNSIAIVIPKVLRDLLEKLAKHLATLVKRLSVWLRMFGFKSRCCYLSHGKLALFLVSGSIEKLFLIDFVNIYLFSIYFSTGFARQKSVELFHIAHIVIH